MEQIKSEQDRSVNQGGATGERADAPRVPAPELKSDMASDSAKIMAEQERAGLIFRMRKQRADIEQYFIDADYWNSLHPSEPIVADPDGVMRRMADALDHSLRNEPQ